MLKCYDLNAIFAFVFTPSPPWLISVFLSSVKIMCFSLELQMSKQLKVFFCLFMVLLVIILISFSEIFQNFTAHHIQRETKFKHEKIKAGFVKAEWRQVFRFLQIYVFYWALRKNGSLDFPEKRAPTRVKHLLPVCQVSWNFTKGNTRKCNKKKTQENALSVLLFVLMLM